MIKELRYSLLTLNKAFVGFSTTSGGLPQQMEGVAHLS